MVDQVLKHIAEEIANWPVYVAIFFAASLRLLLDRVQKKKITIALVLFQYVGGCLCGILAYHYLDPSNSRVVISCSVSLLSRDIITYICTPENLKKIIEKLFSLFL